MLLVASVPGWVAFIGRINQPPPGGHFFEEKNRKRRLLVTS
jgi:hypothetical protein